MYWDWFYYFGYNELLWISLAFLGYVLYLVRVLRLAAQLESHKRWAFLKLPLRTLYFGLLVIALLGPTFGTSRRYVQTVGKDIYVLLDLSRSMNVRDVSPSRFEKARFELKNLVQGIQADRLGIIGFAEDAFLECPLTYDRSALLLFLQSLNTGTIGKGGTDFTPALKMALDRFDDSEERNLQYKSRLIVMISDGEDFGEEYSSILGQLRERGISVFTVGIGTESGGKIPEGNYFVYNSKGKAVVSRLNPNNLQSIAKNTQGRYFCISKDKNEMPQLIQAIKELQGQRIDQKAIKVANNKYIYFLWVALGLMLIDVLFKVKVLHL